MMFLAVLRSSSSEVEREDENDSELTSRKVAGLEILNSANVGNVI